MSRVHKISEGTPHVGDLIERGAIDLVINTPQGGQGARTDGFEIRAAAIRAGIPCITTIEAGAAAAAGHRRGRRGIPSSAPGRWAPDASREGLPAGSGGGLNLKLRPRLCKVGLV